MNTKSNKMVALALLSPSFWAGAAPAAPSPGMASQADGATVGAIAGRANAEHLADKRYEEMLDRMRASVEEISQLYGNPAFLQVFTNDASRASELKERLKAAKAGEDIRRELADLEKRRDELLGDIALREREVSRLAGRLVRQRAALDAVAVAVEQARKAVEDTSK